MHCTCRVWCYKRKTHRCKPPTPLDTETQTVPTIATTDEHINTHPSVFLWIMLWTERQTNKQTIQPYSERFTQIKWSCVSRRSSAEQGEFANQRPTFYRCECGNRISITNYTAFRIHSLWSILLSFKHMTTELTIDRKQTDKGQTDVGKHRLSGS